MVGRSSFGTAGNDAGGGFADVRDVPEFLAPRWIGDMHLDDGDFKEQERIHDGAADWIGG
mgnify:CR=1 FL=1